MKQTKEALCEAISSFRLFLTHEAMGNLARHQVDIKGGNAIKSIPEL